ncbi:MAG: c-type cytochrome [Candidatus Berkiellales bacterium]
MNKTPWWASEEFWKKTAIFITSMMFVILIFLTFQTHTQIQAGTKRVLDYDVINQRIYYRFDRARSCYVPVIGDKAPLFGKLLSKEEARRQVSYGKKVFQSRNCINCHTILGNGAYYAPDLTKAWLDPAWASEQAREYLILKFMLEPDRFARTYGSGRRMPNLHLSEEEARAVIAYLKWVSAIDTNGFPHNFQALNQTEETS